MKTKPVVFHAFPLAFVVTLAGFNAPGQMTLSIARFGNQSVLSWPTTASNCVLQCVTNLAAPSWVAYDNAHGVIVGSNLTVSIANLAKTMFFRLQNTNATFVPVGMALIPAGSFAMGDTLDGDTEAPVLPVSTNAPCTNVYVSAFYMDVNLLSLAYYSDILEQLSLVPECGYQRLPLPHTA